MRRIALLPLLAIVSAPLLLQAQPHEERIEEELTLEQMADLAVALAEGRRGARLGVAMHRWVEGPADGVDVTSVSPGGPAEQGGLKAGDLLTTFNDESLAGASGLESWERLLELMEATEPGTEVTIGYMRGGEDFETQVTTDAWPQMVSGRSLEVPGFFFGRPAGNRVRAIANALRGGDGNVDVEVEVDEGGGPARRIVRMRRDPFDSFSFYDVAWRLQGLQITELTPSLGEYFGAQDGLLVVRAPDNEEIGLEDGDVIRKISGRTFTDARHATRILRSYEPGEEVELEVLRHKRSKTVRFELPERTSEFLRGPSWSGPDGTLRNPMRPRGPN